MSEQRELKFQKHIIASYKSQGGFAEHWNNEWVKGPPDLICCMPTHGVHLVEVKHRPTFSLTIKNPMTPKQREYAENYTKAGGRVILAIVRGGPNAIDSQLGLFSPLSDTIHPSETTWYPYVMGEKYDMKEALHEYVNNGH